MIEIEVRENLKELTRGKKVALVGPAPYLLGKGVGRALDEYDLICRVNDIIPPPEIRGDYGSRTDIMFHNLGTPWMDGLKRKIQEYPDAFSQLKMVVCPVIKSDHSETNYLNWANHYVSNVVTNFKMVNRHDIPFCWIGIQAYKQVYHQIGVEFNSGLGALTMLLNCPVKELLMTGFTFYLGGSSHDELYYEGHWDKGDLKKTTVGIQGGHGYHANMVQVNYFKKLMQSPEHNILIDSYMKQILQL